MCGIVGGLVDADTLDAGLDAILHRGPDGHGTWLDSGWALGHSLLSIQGVGAASSRQPYTEGHTVLTYNGEMWSKTGLIDFRGASPVGDTPMVAAMIDRFGPGALSMLDGMFALAWVDTNTGHAYLARDTYGEVPLHYGFRPNGAPVWASEIRALLVLGAVPSSVRWVTPGTYIRFGPGLGDTPIQSRWAHDWKVNPDAEIAYNFFEQADWLADAVDEAVASRLVANNETPVAVLLSGGLDSSIIVASMIKQGYTPHAYTAVFDPASSDLKHARALAGHWGIELTEVRVADVTAARLSRAVRVAEMPHKAQVEITLACLDLADALHADGYKVVLSGEGSDELWASYGMSYHGIVKQGWGPFRRDLYEGQHRKNFARTNKVFMGAGVEARLPFLDPPLARFAMMLGQEIVQGTSPDAPRKHPKAVLAAAGERLGVPAEHAWRAKKAFQTEARLDLAAAGAVANPLAYYRAEFTTAFRGVKP